VASLNIEGLLSGGFVVLDETFGEELLLGLIGKVWTPSGKIVRVSSEEYRRFSRPGYAKVVWCFLLREISPTMVRLSTETRVLCTDAGSSRRFRLYWLLVRVFSGLIRKEMLRVVKKTVEGT
jgi:hypothetical protein